MKTSHKQIFSLSLLALGLSACDAKVEGTDNPINIPMGQTQQQAEIEILKNPLLGRHFSGPMGSIQYMTAGESKISVQRTCDINVQFCNSQGQPLQDSFILDVTSTQTYSETLENGKMLSVSLTGDASKFTLNEKIISNGAVFGEVSHVMTYSQAPCGNAQNGPGLEDQEKMKTYFDGGSSTESACLVYY